MGPGKSAWVTVVGKGRWGGVVGQHPQAGCPAVGKASLAAPFFTCGLTDANQEASG